MSFLIPFWIIIIGKSLWKWQRNTSFFVLVCKIISRILLSYRFVVALNMCLPSSRSLANQHPGRWRKICYRIPYIIGISSRRGCEFSSVRIYEWINLRSSVTFSAQTKTRIDANSVPVRFRRCGRDNSDALGCLRAPVIRGAVWNPSIGTCSLSHSGLSYYRSVVITTVKLYDTLKWRRRWVGGRKQ